MKDGDKGKQRKMEKQRKQKFRNGSESYLNLIGAWRSDGLLRGLLAILAFALVLTPSVILVELLYRGNRQPYLQIPATFFFGIIMSACFYTLTLARKEDQKGERYERRKEDEYRRALEELKVIKKKTKEGDRKSERNKKAQNAKLGTKAAFKASRLCLEQRRVQIYSQLRKKGLTIGLNHQDP